MKGDVILKFINNHATLIEWGSTFLLIIATLFSAINLYPWNIVFYFFANIGWMIIGFMWNKKSMILVQSVLLAILIYGIIILL